MIPVTLPLCDYPGYIYHLSSLTPASMGEIDTGNFRQLLKICITFIVTLLVGDTGFERDNTGIIAVDTSRDDTEYQR